MRGARLLVGPVLLALMGSPGLVGANAAKSDIPSRALWLDVAERSGLPVELLFAIALQETRQPDGDRIRPWPWTIRAGDEGHWFDTREAAARFLEEQIEDGKENIDIGYMQVNWKYHGDQFDDPTVLLNPQVNVHYGAKVLQESLLRNDATLLGIGEYHSPTEKRARAYGRDVVQWWRKVRAYGVF